jgi:pyrimidine deaminase RibD-like protein
VDQFNPAPRAEIKKEIAVSQKLIFASFVAGIIVGATIMGAIGLHNAAAQSAGQPGLWQLRVETGNGLISAFRLNTATGFLEECSHYGDKPSCLESVREV